MKRILSMMLVIVIALGLMAGCGSDDKGDTVSSQVQQSTDVINKDDVVFVNADGSAVYSIVRPEEGSLDEGTRSSYVFKQIKDAFGIAVKNGSDTTDGADAYEILIGATNRPESKQALDYLVSTGNGRYDDYIICTIGKKIVINAYNVEGLDAACQYFAQNFLKKEGIKGGIEYIYVAQPNRSDITINGTSIGMYSIIRPHFNSSYLTQLEMEKIVDTVYQNTGYMLNILEDEYVEESTYEIVVGNNNRSGVKTITDYDEYDITVSGNKVYLNGGSAHATAMAVSEFTKLLVTGTVTDANSVNGSYETAMAGYDRATTYYPVYFDNFDGDTIDTTKWRLMKGNEFAKDGQNGKRSGMTDDPNYILQHEGNFYIYGHQTDTWYYGGTLTNNHTMRFQYGYVEHSVICPDGDGFWSLLWFDNRGDSENVLFGAEIDLNECFGNGTATQANCHKWPTDYGKSLGYDHVSLDGKEYGAAKKYYHPDGGTWADGYHTFGFLWDETQMTFTADGKIWFSYDITQTPEDVDAFVNAYLYMKLSFSVGRYNNNLLVENLTEYEWQNTNVLICDWIYLYQLDNGKQSLIFK